MSHFVIFDNIVTLYYIRAIQSTLAMCKASLCANYCMPCIVNVASFNGISSHFFTN